MKKKYIRIIVALFSLNFMFQLTSFAQKTVTVKDAGGNPVPGVRVTIGEGNTPVITNGKGEFVLKIDGKTPILLESEGFDSQIVMAYPAVDPGTIVLIRSEYQLTEKDLINLPFGEFKKRQISGAVTALNPSEILKYDQARDFGRLINGRIPGIFGGLDNRGLGNALVVVDGVPRSGADYNLQQIDQISVIKDLSTAMLYGGQAKNGIIYITTKRGQPLKKILSFTAEGGMNKPISYPEFLSSAEYMTLYNEALVNDGLPAKYLQADIDNTSSGADPVHYPDESYFNSTYLKKFSSYLNLVGEANGGSEVAQYYLNVGWNRNAGLLKIGEGANEKKDRINVRGNVDYKLNDVIKIRFDAAVIFNITDQPRYTTTNTNFWTLASTLYPNSSPVLIPSSLMQDATLLGAAKLIDGKYLLGGTSEYQTNIYGELTRNGPTQINERVLEMNLGLDFDLNKLLKGLTASIFFTYDLQNIFRTDIPNAYAVYKPNYTANAITSWSKINTDVKVNSLTLSDVTFSRRNGLYGKADYHKLMGKHELTVNAIGYFDQYSLEGILQPTRHINFGARANYNFRNKYIAELTGVLSGSVKLSETQPWGFSPGIGLGWVVSGENFLKDNSFIHYLKLRTNLAFTCNDEGLSVYNAGHDIYTASTVYSYNNGAGSNASYLLSLGNPNLGMEKRFNYTAGFDGSLLDNKIGVEGTFFYYKTSDVITKRVNYLPAYLGSYYFDNYGSYQNTGVELGINYSGKTGDIIFTAGGNMVYSVPKMLVVDELNYKDDYRKAAGKPADAMFGFVALGLFKDQQEISSSNPQTFGTVKPGDIRYQDLNGDKVIDDLDQKMIGNSHARVEYSGYFTLSYKSFELFALATGQSGSDTYFNNEYYWVYGNRKYSETVKDRWTPATSATATYPRLTTLPNANNFRNSTYWLYKNNWFTLHTAQLTWSLPFKTTGIKEACIFVRGNNLMTFSKIRDKKELNIGTAPQTRFYSLGISIML